MFQSEGGTMPLVLVTLLRSALYESHLNASS